SSEVEAARRIVRDAIAKMKVLNKARFENPAPNRGSLLTGQQQGLGNRGEEDAPKEGFPVLVPTDEMTKAAALLAELEAEPIAAPQKRADAWWMQGLKHLGRVPWGLDTSYRTWRNVVDYGADPSGAKAGFPISFSLDSTAAIQNAIDDGKRCGAKCNGSTRKNAIVYFPPGRYLVSKSISVVFGTQIIGDANNMPTIVASSSYIGLGVLSTDVYVENGGVGPDGGALQWYVNTARFYGQIRNIKIDITATDPGAYVAAMHYQVAQATTAENIVIEAKAGTVNTLWQTQQGIYAENGSGGVISDITFNGGNFGIYGGAQQFSASRLTFNGCNTGVQLIWDWGWSWKSVTMNSVGVGFKLYNDGDASRPGSVSIIDSIFNNMGKAAIEMIKPSDGMDQGYTGVTLDNVQLGGGIKERGTGSPILAAGYYKTYVIGAAYKSSVRTFAQGPKDYTRDVTLLGPSRPGLQGRPYFERARPQYLDKTPTDFVHLKDLGARGDGNTDDTAAIQAAFARYGDGSKIIYVDAGSYIIRDTILIPPGAKVVGETWSQLVANGVNFGDAMKPRPMLRVGEVGSEGSVELQDLILTSRGPTPGLVVVEWNIAASSPGSAALWDVHVRLGGAVGTLLTPTQCPPIRSGINPASCQVASLMLHVTKRASGYFDNMWLWVADHQIDDPLLDDPMNNMEQLTVYSARGALFESQKPVWLYGTASEHSVLYQYNFDNAMTIFTTMLQTESPYYQPTPKPPAPFAGALGVFKSDPFYECTQGVADGCDESWAVVIRKSQGIHVSTAGTYSWFSTYTQDCISPQACQKALWLLGVVNGDDIRIEQLIAIGAKHIFVTRDGGPLITAGANMAVSKHPKWAHVSLMEVPSQGRLDPERFPEKNDCLDSDKMYSSEVIPVGTLAPFAKDGSTLNGDDDQQLANYVNIVNLTPYRFIREGGPTPYQVRADFKDIPSGRARQARVDYEWHQSIDWTTTNGYFYYRLEGTNKRFNIHLTTHMDDKYERRVVFDLAEMGMGWRELGFPGNGLGVALVISGSESYGYYNSLQLNHAGWQQRLKDVISKRQLRHVVVPGSHDAGMSLISPAWLGLGTSSNTATQSLDLYNQLRVGARYFDMRIYSVLRDSFWAAHINSDDAAIPVGATGASLNDLISGMNRFSTDFPGEVVVWYIKGMQEITSNHKWDLSTQQLFLESLEGINNRCADLPLQNTSPGGVWIDTITMGDYMSKNGGKGCVLLVLDRGRIPPELEFRRPSAGIYSSDNFRRHDAWPEKNSVQGIFDYHSGVLLNKPRTGEIKSTGSEVKDDYLITQWQLTFAWNEQPSSAQSLNARANQETNPAIYHTAMSLISPDHFPTAIMTDAIGLFHTYDLSEGNYNPMLQTLCIGLNLYMVSQNCAVSPIRNPLIGGSSSVSLSSFDEDGGSGNGTSPAAGSQVVATGSGVQSVFTGVIFANGTVLEERPADFCRTCTYNDTTVIDHPP
ncbi:pectate lyase superfamily protein-domain-containing protein, partial [Microdochium trichocladiopsis]